jgi:MEMO1 family protein
MLIRKPHVAGSFYPSEAAEIRKFCDAYSAPSVPETAARAVILPHAGYVYSGQTACQVLAQVKIPDTIVLIGPNHWSIGSDFALYENGKWETPLGRIPVAESLAKQFVKAGSDLKIDWQAHAREHSLEVLLPLLQCRKGSFSIVPLIVGTLDFQGAARAAESIGSVLKDWKEPFLVAISNDMSHYEPDEVTRKKDKYALDAITALDKEALLFAVRSYNITMCGLVPVYMLLCMKDALGIKKARLVDYRTSADASGDTSRVVGYAGFIFE